MPLDLHLDLGGTPHTATHLGRPARRPPRRGSHCKGARLWVPSPATCRNHRRLDRPRAPHSERRTGAQRPPP
eukprot:1831976-Heterocapsa_arctica.AAC.1